MVAILLSLFNTVKNYSMMTSIMLVKIFLSMLIFYMILIFLISYF